MGEIGSGGGSSYPTALDTDASQESTSTVARADVPNDLASATVAIQTELGTDPAGTKTDVKTYLQTEHNANGTHKTISVGNIIVTDGRVEFDVGADVASATNLPILSDGNFFDVTGTTAIETIDSADANSGVGSYIALQFDAILTLTHNATDLILPGGINRTTAAGDIAIFYKYAAGDWRLVNYQVASGAEIFGSAQFLGSAASPPDTNTITKENIVKAWVNFDGDTGDTATINSSFNITSVARTGEGAYTITFNTDFADANYVIAGTCFVAGTTTFIRPLTWATGSATMATMSDAAAAIDCTTINVMVIGNQ